MARRMSAAAGNPFSGANTGASTPGFPASASATKSVGHTGPHRHKKAGRKRHGKKRG